MRDAAGRGGAAAGPRSALIFLHEGITFTVYGDEASIERAFPIDCVPRLLLAREWAHIERGLIQCVQALNLFLSDVYDKGHLLRDGSVPRDLVYGCPNYRPEMEGVADDKAVYAYVPRMIRYYLDQDPILDNVETHLCREPEGLAYTLENLEHLVVKAVGESGGYGMLVGPHASREEREAFADKLRAKPENYISQPTLALSRAPCLVEGRLEARHVDLRPFVLHGEDTRVVPCGLCRVALRLQEIALVDVWRRDPAMLYRDVIQAVQLFDGICASSMRQDTGWHFMRLGRFIERVQLVGSLLEAHCAATKDPSEGKGDWVGLLWACDAFEAYCQLHGAQIREEKVLDFLGPVDIHIDHRL